jgi:four helix bundle protein
MRRNPKSEIRDPKKARNPRSESGGVEGVLLENSAIGSWGKALPDTVSILKEDGTAAPAPAVRDLRERTAQFGEAIIRFAKRMPQHPVNHRLIDQLVGAGTCVGANFCEAINSVSGKDFKKSIGICRKESQESMFFLRMCATAEPGLADDARKLWQEAKELNLIFGAIWRK